MTPIVAGRARTFCAHRASLDHPFAPNSLAAVKACVAEGAPRVEIDVRFLADDAMLVFHDRDLDDETTGAGPVANACREGLAGVRYRHGGEPLAYLEDVVAAVAGSATLLQVDLKGLAPYTPRQNRHLIEVLTPLGDQVLAGSQAHWNVRSLANAGIPTALDPTLHWHFAPERERAGLSPATLGRHGLWDDSPLAHLPGLGPTEYLEARIADLVALVPAIEWMVDYRTLLFMEANGLRLGERLRQDGVRLAAWTVHDEGPDATRSLLGKLFEIGAEVVITDDPPRCSQYLEADTVSPQR
ncbi:MAG: glycerophosphodiester phosphodiesterase [Dehalococcoidia bacterium]